MEFKDIDPNTILEISDPVDGQVFFEGTKQQCAEWLFERQINHRDAYKIDQIAEEENPDFELPDHLKKQRIY
jgi:hypothetical protein